jgi:ribosome biogenesis protein Nip4
MGLSRKRLISGLELINRYKMSYAYKVWRSGSAAIIFLFTTGKELPVRSLKKEKDFTL